MKITKKQEQKMKKSFKNFVYVIWKSLGLPVPTDVQYDISDYLQHGQRRIQIQAFRGVGKSYLTVAFAIWVLWNDPEKKIMVVSAGKDRAMEFSIFMKQIIHTNDFLSELKAGQDQRDSNIMFDVGLAKPSGSPSVKSIGITGQLTGSRADIIIADDIETPKNCNTHDLREKLVKLVAEFDAVLKPDGRIIYLGTPQTELSLYNTLYKKGYDMRIWTARVPDERESLAHGAKLAPYIRSLMKIHKSGTPTDPKRFDDADLKERELSYGRSGFALQFQLDTSLSDSNKFPLKLNDLIISGVGIDKAPSEIYWSNSPLNQLKELPNLGMGGQYFFAPDTPSDTKEDYSMRLMVVDPSGRGTDETAYCILLFLNGNIFVPEFGGFNNGYEEKTLETLSYIAKRYKVHTVVTESNFGDGMFNSLLQPVINRIHPCSLEEVRHNTQKEVRIIDTLEPVMNQHRLIIDPKAIQKDYDDVMTKYSPDVAPSYSLVYQMTRLSKERGSLKHDDRLDALAMGVRWFTDRLNVDQKNAKDRKQQEDLDKMLDDFARECEIVDTSRGLNLWRRLK